MDGEIREMIDLYTGKGMSPDDATQVVTIMSKYKVIQILFTPNILLYLIVYIFICGHYDGRRAGAYASGP